jgi:putative ABC transport system substrate-binding protein
MIKTRRINTLVLAICLGFCLAPVPAHAAPSAKVLLINSNAAVEKYRVAQEEFQKTLNDQRLMAVDLAGKRPDRAAGRKMEAYDPDLVYAIGAQAYSDAIDRFTKETIVFSSIINWLRLPMSEDIYGVSNELHSRMPLMLFRYVFPAIKRIGVLHSAQYTAEWFADAKAQAEELGITLIGAPVHRKGAYHQQLEALFDRADALWLVPDPLVMPEESDLYGILDACDAEQWPVFSYHSAFPYFGAVLSVAADNPTIGRQAAKISAAVLSGKPVSERIQFPAGSHVTLNMEKVKAYGLEYNAGALGAVNHIIK